MSFPFLHRGKRVPRGLAFAPACVLAFSAYAQTETLAQPEAPLQPKAPLQPEAPSQTTTAAQLDTITVTSTREGISLRQTPAAISVIGRENIDAVAPAHPQELLRQAPGVAIASTNGEGHTTAIRQPFNTSPVYLFLEDGIPIRATGFFNHNALYEINLPQAGSVEVVRGPGSALYGSDAIGGIVNVLTRTPTSTPGASANAEFGTYGWQRLLLSGNTGLTSLGAIRIDANLTHTDGWRDRSAYDRRSLGIRSDLELSNGALLKTIVNYTDIDQETGAGSNLSENDFRNNPTRNYLGIAYRRVTALRASMQYEQTEGNDLISVTPYFRDNRMDLFASFNLGTDPSYNRSQNQSFGLLSKWRRDFPHLMKARLIAGLDIEHSPGKRQEDSVTVTRTNAASGNQAERVFSNPRDPKRIFDYNVNFRSLSPYVHGEISATDALRLTVGLRHDRLRYDMDNNIASAQNSNAGNTGQAGSTGFYFLDTSAQREFQRTSPKIGFTIALSPQQTLYGSYNTGFRAPSESQLFRSSRASTSASINTTMAQTQAVNRAISSLNLQAIEADQLELGLRGNASDWHYDATAYLLTKKNDLTSVRDPQDPNNRININAGQTRHMGMELALGYRANRELRVDMALSYSLQRYEDNTTANGNFSGKDIPNAPRALANTIMTWTPTEPVQTQLEWTRIGSYWLDDANTFRYGGHSLFNLRGRWKLNDSLALFARLNNITDRRYAESAAVFNSTGTPTPLPQITYSPGLPRALYAGVDYRF